MYRNFGFALAAAAIAVASPASASVVYQSVADMGVGKVDNAWCADCFYYQAEVQDQFTLSSAASITGVNLWIYASGGYENVTNTGYNLKIYDSTRSTVLFSQLVLPITVFETRQGGFSQEWNVGGSLSGLNLGAGTYWAGFEASTMGVMSFVGGNGSLRQVGPNGDIGRNDNAGYQLTSSDVETGAVPEPASWALMVGGFGLVGGALRSRRRTAVTFA